MAVYPVTPVPDGTTVRELHPYDVMVYTENGHYYARDSRRNLICVDSPTACLQESINYVAQLGGGRIYVRSGNYNVSNTVTISSSNIKIYGDATLVVSANVTAININNANNISIENIAISGGEHGILITNSQRVKIEGVRVSGAGLYGIYIYDSPLVDASENYVENTQQCGIAIESYNYNVYGIYVRSNKIINAGQSKQGCSDGIHVENHNVITDVDITGNYVANAGLTGIAILASQYISIRSNIVINSGTDGIAILASLYSRIEGNIVSGSGQNKTAGYQNGIRIDDSGVTPPSQYNAVVHNVLVNNIGQAISERGSANYNMIINNMTVGNGTPQIITSGANTVVINTVGYVTRASGQTTISANTTSVTVSHGLSCTPAKVLTTPLAQPPGSIWISGITSTQFTINISAAPTANLPIAWYAEC